MRRFVLLAALALLALTLIAKPAPAAVLLSERFATSDGLITNEWAHWNAGGVESPAWEMTSGSLFARDGAGWTGVPDDCAPDRTSSGCTNSAVFRLNSRRADFGDVRVDARLRANGWASTPSTPAVAWDGVHLWLRYRAEEELYYASVNRRDGTVVVKKKCRGGQSNGGTYYTLASRSEQPVTLGAWQRVAASVENLADGSVAIELFREGERLLRAVDAGTGCAPIRSAGAVGVRGDNLDFDVDDFAVTELYPAGGGEGGASGDGEGGAMGGHEGGKGSEPEGSEGGSRPDSLAGGLVLRVARRWRRGRTLRVRVEAGEGAASVSLSLDARRIAFDRRAPFVFRIRASRNLRRGIHRLQATSSDGSHSRVVRVRYR